MVTYYYLIQCYYSCFADVLLTSMVNGMSMYYIVIDVTFEVII